MVRAVMHLSPAQVVHRARLRTNRLRYRLPWMGPRPASTVDVSAASDGWPTGYEPLDQFDHPEPTSAEQLRRREFDLVGVTHTVSEGQWEPAGVSQLWRYHLHYFEWAWALVGAPDGPDVFEELWRDWQRSTRLGRGDAWSPYAASLRAWSMCGLYAHLVERRPIEHDYRESLGAHAGYLLHNIELDVGGNHLMKNIKALFGLGVFLGDAKLITKARRLLARELPVQVLPDGGHYERSPSYHAQVLGDLIDIHGLLEAADDDGAMLLVEPIGRMARWLSAMVMPDGSVPLLRDCVPVSQARLHALGVDRSREGPRLEALPDSGYVIVRAGKFHAVLDVGQPCPRRLPAHAQADSLNWVLHVDGQPVIVDTGTSSYQDPEIRAYERSTAAHNTVEIDGENSTEVFGSFRAGRRARVTLVEATDDGEIITVTGEHDGYRFLDGSPVHRRTWTVSGTEVTVSDLVSGGGNHSATSRVLVLDGANRPESQVAIEMTPPAVTSVATRAVGMGRRETDAILHASAADGELPLRLQTRVSVEQDSSA